MSWAELMRKQKNFPIKESSAIRNLADFLLNLFLKLCSDLSVPVIMHRYLFVAFMCCRKDNISAMKFIAEFIIL